MVSQERCSEVQRALEFPTPGQIQTRSPSAPESRTNERNPVSVLFGMPGGESYEGRVPYGIDEMVFVESSWSIPVGSEVFFRLTSTGENISGDEVFRGTVVWQCTAEDQFKNGKGFGVCVQGRRPQPPPLLSIHREPTSVSA